MAMFVARNFGLHLFLCVLVCLSPVFVTSGLVVRTNTVTVLVGRTVYLNTDDIVIKKMKKSDEGCRIEVVQNDPITQRVGQLEPKVRTMCFCIFSTTCRCTNTWTNRS